MHQVLLQCRIGEKVVLVNLVLLFVALANLLLRHDLLQEIDEADSHVGIGNSSVENDGYRSCELCLEILIDTVVGFSVDLHEQLWKPTDVF